MKLSTRNQLPGTVTSVTTGEAMAVIRIKLDDGPELTAHIATFTQVRDGRIFRHATYDCYEAFS